MGCVAKQLSNQKGLFGESAYRQRSCQSSGWGQQVLVPSRWWLLRKRGVAGRHWAWQVHRWEPSCPRSGCRCAACCCWAASPQPATLATRQTSSSHLLCPAGPHRHWDLRGADTAEKAPAPRGGTHQALAAHHHWSCPALPFSNQQKGNQRVGGSEA